MKLTQKLIATILTVMMLMGYVSTLTTSVIAAGIDITGQTSKTNHANVEFDSYFDEGLHSKTFEIGKEAKIYLKLKVSNAGYLKNGVVKFSDANFEIDSKNLKNDKVQSSSKDEIKLKQINNNSAELVIEVPIYMPNGETVAADLFNKISTAEFTGTYIDAEGKEKTIKKQISNELKWQGKAEIDLAGNVSKYKPYQVGEEKGVLVQAKVRASLKENSLPVATTKLELSIPEIKLPVENEPKEGEETTTSLGKISAIKPERITVVANTTEGTNGKGSTEFNKSNYNYNEETNKLEIEVKNNAENGKIAWNKNAADEYLVNYVFVGEEVYSYVKEQLAKASKTVKTEEEKKQGKTNENAITGEIEVKAEIEAYNSEKLPLEKTGKISYSVENEKGAIVDSFVTATSKISKGYIYANYAKAEKQANKQLIEKKKETEYEVNYTKQINDKNLVDSVEFETISEKYVDAEGNEHSSKVGNKENIYVKAVKISETIFNKMLGEEGKIEITNQKGAKLAEITKDTQKDEAGNYIVNIAESKVNEIKIKTTKPASEGNITITLEKVIASEQSYTKAQMQSFEKISINKTVAIKLEEPVSKAEVSVGTQNLSTVVENKDVEIRTVLDTSSVSNALYKNPLLQIVLPENIEKLNVKSVELLLDDELKIKGSKVEEQNGRKVIIVELEGTQTQYMNNENSKAEGQNIIAKGANIVIKADITFKKLAPSASSNILLYYTNQNSNLYENVKASPRKARSVASTNNGAVGMASTGIEIVSPNGVVTENSMTGFNENNTINNITTQKQEQIVNVNAASKEVTVGGTIVNNYATNIGSVMILGRTPFSGNKQIDDVQELGSNFTMKMKSKITTSGIDSSKIKVYYSTNGEATKDLINGSNGWTENPSNLADVKSYLIVIGGDVNTGAQFKFEYKAELPANLGYDKSSYTTYKVYYDNKIEGATLGETKVAGTIGLVTGKAPDLSVELSSTVDTIREGQIVKMKATVKNTGAKTAKNVKVNVPLPQNTKFMEYVTGTGFYDGTETSKVLNVGSIDAGKSKQVSYYIKINDTLKPNAMGEGSTLTQEEIDAINKYPKEISHKVTVTADELTTAVYSNEYKFSVLEGKIALSLSSESSESDVIRKGDVISYMLKLTNISRSGDLENTVVTIPLPNGVKYKDAEIKDGWDSQTSTTEGVSYNETANTITVNIGTLEIQKMILFNAEVQSFEGSIKITAKAKADGTEEHYSNITEYTSEIINLEVSELTSTPKYVKEGSNVTYTLKLTNKGKSLITGIHISDTLPEGLTFTNATYTYNGKEENVTTLTDGKVEIIINQLEGGASTTVKIIAKAGILPDKNDKEIVNSVSVRANNYNGVNTNAVTNVIEYYKTIHDQADNITKPTTPDDPSNPETPETQGQKITGVAWIDTNKDGKRDKTEELLSGVQVMLLYKSNSQVVVDANGNQKITTTNNKGQYEFSNLAAGEYLVIFVYDAGKYSITGYQVKSVDSGYNSDAISMKVTLNGEQRYVGVTDIIKVTDANIRDIDIGLYVAEKFDLRLDKYITKTIVNTPTSGTKTYSYNNSKIVKREVYAKDVNNSSMIVEYKIVVTNEGQVAGYAKKIIDYLPEDVRFSTELNKDWYISDNNGVVYNTSLANELIQPGQSKEVILTLTVPITDKNMGTIINNNAEIYESYNEQGIRDYDSQEANRLESEDDMSNADIMISMATGKIIIYTTFALGIVMLLGLGVFEIKRRVLDNKKN